jgi:hypothetical protein
MTVDRPFGSVEMLIDALDNVGTMNFVTLARVRGPLSPEALDAALRKLQARHPLLACRIVRDGRRPRFAHDARLRIPVTRVAAPVDGWVEASQRELDRAAWPADEAPARLLVLEHGGDHFSLLLSCNHRVSDGTSNVLALRDLLRFVWEPGHAPPPLPTAPMEAYLPPALRGYRRAAQGARYWGKRFARELSAAKPERAPHAVEVPVPERKVRVLARTLSRAATGALAQRARSERATVHSALSAALLAAFHAQLKPGQPCTQQCNHPVNLRPLLRALGAPPELDERMGYLISYLESVHTLSGSDDTSELWQVARDITQELRAGRDANHPLVTLPLASAVMRRIARHASPRTLRVADQLLLHSSFILTNLGRLPVQEEFAGGEVEAIHFVAASSFACPVMVAVTTFKGQLQMNVCYQSPTLDDALMAAVTDRAVATIERLVAEPN